MALEGELKALPLIARGGQADIYAYGDGRILRAARRPQDFDRIRYEYCVYSWLSASNIAVPKVYDLVQVNESPAIIMERLIGTSMMDQIRKNPLSARVRAGELAKLHLHISGTEAPKHFVNVKDKAAFCIGKSKVIREEAKAKILDILKELPDGISLCHGDFHPGNIIHSKNRDYVIDWSAASRGDPHADIAHTYVLLRIVPRVPLVSPWTHFLQKRIGRAIATTYLSTILQNRKLNARTFSRWTLINAAERTFHGMPSEKETLKLYIERYLAERARGTDEDFFYEMV